MADYDKFPGLLENPAGYRKGSDDYGVTFAVPIKYVPRLQPLMQKVGRVFVVYLVQVSSAEQAELLMNRDDSGLEPQLGTPEPQLVHRLSSVVSVEELSSWLCCGERNVQILENKGIAIKAGRGQYDLKASVQGYIRERHAKGDGKNSDYSRERTAAMTAKRQLHEVEYQEKVGALVNAAEARKAFEKVMGLVRQRWLLMPKYLAPRLDSLPAREQEAIMEDYVRESLSSLAAPDLGGRPDPAGMPDHGPAAAAHPVRVGRRKKKARQ